MATFSIRKATLVDQDFLKELIAQSIRTLGADVYSSEQIEAALKGAFGVDTQLIQDGTYFVVEQNGTIVACGGWSFRKTLFGSNEHQERDPAELNPKIDAAKIRAFFVSPEYARQGLGKAILMRCEAEAKARGFRRAEMMATLPGIKLYSAMGYRGTEQILYQMTPELSIEFLPMSKSLA